MTWDGRIRADARQLPIAEESVQCVVTSPPYWGLRQYDIPPSIWGGDFDCDHEWGAEQLRGGPAGGQGSTSQRIGRTNVTEQTRQNDSLGAWCQICNAWRGCFGLEPTPELYVIHAVAIFREVWRVLRHDGTLWLNLGDCYATGAGKVGECPGGGEQGARWRGDIDRIRDGKRGYRTDRLDNGRGDQPAELRQKTRATRDGSHAGKHTAIASLGPMQQPNRMPIPGLKPKDLVGIPWRVAFALQTDGWYLRRDIIWHKPNPMPESVTDRPTTSHEYVFLLAKSGSYFYDADAIAEPCAYGHEAKYDPGTNGMGGGRSYAGTGATTRRFKSGNKERKFREDYGGNPDHPSNLGFGFPWEGTTRNKRSVWTVATSPYPEAHYATFPPDLVTPCILAGSRVGDLVLDPFFGSGTVGRVAEQFNRRWIGCDLGYQELQAKRLTNLQKVLIP